jgi:hypothetical protein
MCAFYFNDWLPQREDNGYRQQLYSEFGVVFLYITTQHLLLAFLYYYNNERNGCIKRGASQVTIPSLSSSSRYICVDIENVGSKTGRTLFDFLDCYFFSLFLFDRFFRKGIFHISSVSTSENAKCFGCCRRRRRRSIFIDLLMGYQGDDGIYKRNAA